MTNELSMEFVADGDPRDALAQFIDVATPALAPFEYTVEGRGGDWAQWTRGFQDVIRAYAFRDSGVRIFGQGEVPARVADALSKVAEATGLRARPTP